MTRLLVAAATPFALVAVGGLPATVDPDDQAAADAAVAVFNERLTDTGWTSTGPFTQSQPAAEEEGEFGACLDGVEQYRDYTDLHFDGETARAFSDNFELVGDAPVSTGSVGDYGYAGAVVLTAEESAVGVLDGFVAQLGAEETLACIAEQSAFASMDAEDSSVELAMSNEANVGVGDASARLDFSVTMDYQGSDLSTSATFAAARVDRTLVVVAAGGSGAGASSLDPVAELAAMVDTFD
jgi:hypothetical protein